jgi:hypothetical protein
VIGYLIGDRSVDALMGRSVWIRQAGHALEHAERAGLYRVICMPLPGRTGWSRAVLTTMCWYLPRTGLPWMPFFRSASASNRHTVSVR